MANSHLSVHWMAALDGMDASEPDSSQSDHYYNSYSPEDNAVNIPNVNEESNSLPLGYLRVCRTETNSILSEILNGLDPEKFPKGSKYLSFQLTPLEAFLLRQLISIVAPAMNIFAADSFYTLVVPWVGIHDRCFLESLLAVSALNVMLTSPGTLQKDVYIMYRNSVLRELDKYFDLPPAFDDSLDPSNRHNKGKLKLSTQQKGLYVWAYSAIVMIDTLANRVDGLDQKFRYGYKLIVDLAEERELAETSTNNGSIHSRTSSSAYTSNQQFFTNTNGKPNFLKAPVSFDISETVPRDVYIICYCFLFSTDILYSNRTNSCCIWSPEFASRTFDEERLPISYTNEWWVLKIFIMIARLQKFYHYSGPPKPERLQEWQQIYDDLSVYGASLPQSLRPYGSVSNNSQQNQGGPDPYAEAGRGSGNYSIFKNIYVYDEYGIIASVAYHSGVIWALHSRPNMTEEEKNTVPPGSLEHAYTVLGILACCEKPTLWVTTYWAHRMASICLEEPEARDDALELSRQYEWQTGYTSDMHLEIIQTRWDELDEYKRKKQEQQRNMRM